MVRVLSSHQCGPVLIPGVDTMWVEFGYVFLEKSKSGFTNPKMNFAFFWANRKTDHESIKSTFRVDSSDQIQIWSFEIHNVSVFLGKDLKKVLLTSGFSKIMVRNRYCTCMTF